MGGKTMNKTYLCVLPLALALAASSSYSVADDIECDQEPDKKAKCEGDPQAPMVNLNLEALEANPQCVLANRGATIVFRLTPKKGLKRGTVEIATKDPFDIWLQGKNDDFVDLIIIEVPGIHEPDKKKPPTEHRYSIRTPKKCLDPRVEVQH
jgi:hypothetical protein